MAIFILKRGLLDEKNFSIGGKRRKDKRKAYELKQQRLAQQNQQAKPTSDKLPAKNNNGGTTAIVPVNNTVINQDQSKNNQKKGNSPVVNPPVKVDSSGTANMPVTTNDKKQQNNQSSREEVGQKNLPVIVNNKPEGAKGEQASNTNVPVVNSGGEQKKENINTPGGNNEKDWKVGPFPTGQQGTTGNVDWMALGKAAWRKSKPIRVGAGILGGAALGATLLAANKVGKTVDNAMDDVEDRLEQHRQLRRLKQERRIYERQLR